MTENPSSRHYPEGVDPDRAPTDPASLRTNNEEFLDDLNSLMDRPYTKDEHAAQTQNAEEARQLIQNQKSMEAAPIVDLVDGSPLPLENEAQLKRWVALDTTTKELFVKERRLFNEVGGLIALKPRDAALISLADQAREAHQLLGKSCKLYLDGAAIPKAFTEAIQIAIGQLKEIEQRLATHP